MKKLLIVSIFGTMFAVAIPAIAATSWNVTGSYDVDFEYLGSHYVHDMNLAQDSSDNLSGSGGYPAGGGYTYTWVIDSGTVAGNTVNLTAHYTASADAVTPLTTMTMTGTIASDGSISGTWHDNYQGGSRDGTWSTTSGTASHVIPACSSTSSFDSFTLGSVNGQGGWGVTGPYDQEIVNNTYGYTTFGCKSLRISDAVTSGSFGDQVFSSSVVNEAGEQDALNGGFSGGVRQNHFEAQFDLASTMVTLQPGMHFSVSPDRGDGARMSYLRFEDAVTGINVFFVDVQGTNNPANFVETQIASGLSRTLPHTIKFVMDFVDGPSNDVVKIYIDNILVHTGTSWENYYRFDPESNPSLVSNSRTVDSLLFRESGSANPSNLGKGFLIDNYSLTSSTNLDIGELCKNNGWKSFINPVFTKNQGECVSFYANNKKPKAWGHITMSNPSQKFIFTAVDYGVNSSADTGMVEYWNYDYPGPLHYTAPVLCSYVNQSTKDARIMFQIPNGWPGLTGIYVISSVHDGTTDTYSQAATSDLNAAKSLCENGGGSAPYTITSGDLIVK